MLISLSANHATSSATTIESVTAASTNNAAITSITNTITRIKHVAGFENLTSFLIVMIFICGMYSVGVFFTGFASFIYELHPKVQVDSNLFPISLQHFLSTNHHSIQHGFLLKKYKVACKLLINILNYVPASWSQVPLW